MYIKLLCLYVSHSVLSNSLQSHGLQPVRLLSPWDSSGKNTRMGCHFVLQGIFPIQGSNPRLPHCRQILYNLSHQGSPNLLYLPLFNFTYLFFLSFLFFLSSQHISQFSFHCYIPHLVSYFTFVFQLVLYLVLFLTGRYNFWIALFTVSIYCILFLLDCFDFANGCICICVYSIILIIICLIL